MKILTKIPLWLQILIGMALGMILGAFNKSFSIELKILGDVFIQMIKMTIVPLIFPLIILGLAKIKSEGTIGRLTIKALIYFEVVTTIIIVMAVLLANFAHIGAGANLAGGSTDALKSIASTKMNFSSFVLNIIPANIFVAFSQNNLLAILYFGLFFGLAARVLKEKAKPLLDVLEALSNIMFKVIGYVMKFAPIGVFGSLAYGVATYGFGKLSSLIGLVLVVYAALAIVLVILNPIIARIFGIKYWELIKEIKDLLLIAFTTRSIEVIFAPLMERLEGYGANNSVVSFILPLGYSFNLDGTSLYLGPAVIFLAHAYGVHFSVGQTIQVILLLMLLTKGVAGVPSASIVILSSVCTIIGIPLEGIALLIAVDYIMDMPRTATTAVGNALATVAIAKSEGMFREKGKIESQGNATIGA